MPRMRMIADCYHLLKQEDPETALTLCALRRLVKDGSIPSVHTGRKVLVDYDQLLAYLSRPFQSEEVSQSNEGPIRPINVNL